LTCIWEAAFALLVEPAVSVSSLVNVPSLFIMLLDKHGQVVAQAVPQLLVAILKRMADPQTYALARDVRGVHR